MWRHSAATRVRFSAICASEDDARALLVEHCMTGMHVASPRPPLDEPMRERYD